MSIKTKFCPKCGTETRASSSLCPNCYLNAHSLKLPKRKSIRWCPVCNSTYMKGIWVKSDKRPEEFLANILKEQAKFSGQPVQDLKLSWEKGRCKAKAVIKFEGKELRQTQAIDASVVKYACPECSREKATTYTATLQVRTNKDPRGFIAEVLSFLKLYKKKFVKAEEQPKGIDIQLADKRLAKKLGKKLKDHFNMKAKVSVSQYGWDRDKDRPQYRLTILLRQG